VLPWNGKSDGEFYASGSGPSLVDDRCRSEMAADISRLVQMSRCASPEGLRSSSWCKLWRCFAGGVVLDAAQSLAVLCSHPQARGL
jgi:hypothetical protein